MRRLNKNAWIQSVILAAILIITSLLPGCSRPPVAEFGASITVGQAPLVVEFINKSKNADDFHWDFGDGTVSESVDTTPIKHQYTKAGSFEVVLSASVKKGDNSLVNTSTLTIEVNHGQLAKVDILPDQIQAPCGTVQKFVAEAIDAYGNPIPEAQFYWSITTDAGSIDSIGTVVPSTHTGTYLNSVKVIAKLDNKSVEDTASILIVPGSLHRVLVIPQAASLNPGESRQFSVEALDAYNNQITDVQLLWQVSQGTGIINQNGLFTAGGTTGFFDPGISVTAKVGTDSVTTSSSLTIRSGTISPSGTQVLRVNLGGEPNTIDPSRASWALERSVIMQCFDGLLAFNPDLRLKPMVAKEIPTIANGGISLDGKTYTFRLRTDVTWSDGKKVTARDFEYGIKRMLSPELGAEYASFYFDIVGAANYYSAREKTPAEKVLLRDAIGVKAKDDYTLEIVLTNPRPTLLNLMALTPSYPIREDVVSQFGDKWAEPPFYIGNGPFVLKEWVHNDRMTFVRNDNYWGDKQYLTQIDFKMITDANIALAAYRNNELDQSGVPGGTEKATMADPILSKDIVRDTQLVTYAFQFNVLKAPYNNKLFRQALATAIDRTAFIDQVRGGVGTPAFSWIPPDMPGYDPELGKQYAFNPTKAKELLAQAGYSDPTTINIKFQYSNSGINPAIAAFLRTQLKNNLGIDLTLESMDPKTYTQLVNSKQFDFCYAGWGSDYPDPDNWLPQLFTTNAANNKTGYSNSQFDTLAAQALKECDETSRLQFWANAHAIVVEDCPMIFLYHRDIFVLKKSWVNGEKTTGMDGQIPGDMYFREIYIER